MTKNEAVEKYNKAVDAANEELRKANTKYQKRAWEAKEEMARDFAAIEKADGQPAAG